MIASALLFVVAAELPLEWTAPPACPTRADVEAHARAYLGRELAADDTVLRARATIVPSEAGDDFRLELDLEAGSGAEHFGVEDDDCAVLAEVVGLKLALAIDAIEVVEAPPAPAASPAPVVSPPAPPAAAKAPVEVAAAAPAPARLHAIVPITIGVRWGVAPSFGPVVALGVGIGARRWRAWAQGSSDLPRTVALDDGDRRLRLDATTGAVGARACIVAPGRRIELSACGGADAGVMRGRARDVAHARTSHEPWVAAVIGLGFEWWVHPALAVTARAGLLANVVRPGFRLTVGADLYRTPAAAAELAMGLQMRLPSPRSGLSREKVRPRDGSSRGRT